jgi:polysaccharide export outer membrane protein
MKTIRARSKGYLVAALLVAVFSVAALAQQQRGQEQYRPRSSSSSGGANAPGMLVSPGEDYRIGPGDVIEIQIGDAPELSTPGIRVNANGTFLMRYIGRVPAKDKTVEELQDYIADRLRGRYLKDPQVTVIVRQINSRTFFIQGAVRSPGVYQIEGTPSLLTLISVAGGLADNYGSTAFILRATKPEGQQEAEGGTIPRYELIQANIGGLMRGRFDQNIALEPGDFVNIPFTDVFFVAGEVRAPGSFPLKDGTTLRQAISLAQGTTFRAADDNAVIFRDDPITGTRKEIRVDIKAIMNGKKEDLAIQANDIIIVPNSRAKSVGSVIINSFSSGLFGTVPYVILRR